MLASECQFRQYVLKSSYRMRTALVEKHDDSSIAVEYRGDFAIGEAEVLSRC